MDTDTLLLQAEEAMTKADDYVNHEFSSVRTGKAHPSLVEGISVAVKAYGSSMKLKQLATINTPEPRLIVIQPFDPSTTSDIERSIKESKLGIQPIADGKMIRLPIPELSEERRKELVKVIKNMAEEARVRVRSARRSAMDNAKQLQKDAAISEDDLHRVEKEIQELTDKYIKDIDTHLSKKETELLTV